MKQLSLGYGLTMAGIIFCLDRLAKYIVSTSSEIPFDVTSWFSIDYVLNRGISWGLFAFTNTIGFVFVSSIITLLLGIIFWWTYRIYKRNEPITAQLFIIGGGGSNIIDRILYNGVIDYIGITIAGWHFAWFNLADVAINLGVIMLVIQGLNHE